MSTLEIAVGASVPLRRTIAVGLTPQTGATVYADVVRLDGLALDWSDNTFKEVASIGGSNRYKLMPPADATYFAGSYQYTWDTSTIVNPTTPDRYVVNYSETVPLTIPALDQDEYLVGAFIASRASATALATAQGNITTILGYGAPPSAVAISSQVASDLATAHGAGSWATASVAGLATGQNVLDAVTAIEAYGQIHWITATGFAMAGDAMTLTGGERTAIASAVWATVISANETLGQAGGALYALKQVALNVLVETDGNPGSVVIMKDDGVTARFTYAIRDKDAGAVTAETGEPARRGAAVAT